MYDRVISIHRSRQSFTLCVSLCFSRGRILLHLFRTTNLTEIPVINPQIIKLIFKPSYLDCTSCKSHTESVICFLDLCYELCLLGFSIGSDLGPLNDIGGMLRLRGYYYDTLRRPSERRTVSCAPLSARNRNVTKGQNSTTV